MTKTKQTSCKYRPKPNPFLSKNREIELSFDMNQDASQEHLINTSPPASPDEVQPVLPLAQGELTQDDPTESLRNPDIKEADAEMQEEENPSSVDETPELEEAGEDTTIFRIQIIFIFIFQIQNQ